MPTKMYPLRDYVVVKIVEKKEKTPGGIFLPDQSKEEKAEGTVIAVGPGRVTDSGMTIPVRLDIGDCVVFGKYAGDEVKVSEETYRVLRESEILLRVVDNETECGKM